MTYSLRSPRKIRSFAAPFALGALLAFGGASAARADDDAPGRSAASGSFPATAEAAAARIAAIDDGVRSYRAAVRLDLRLRSFPFLAKRLSGETYYARPGRYALVLDRPPSYAKGIEKLCSDLADVGSWNRRYVMTLAPEERIDGKREVVLRLVQRVRGMIDHEDVSVDPQTWRIDRIVWHYYNGGTIAMTQRYGRVGPYVLLAAQRAEIAIPHVRAVAEAVYSDYRTNVSFERDVSGP